MPSPHLFSGNPAWNAAWANSIGGEIFATSLHDGYYTEPSGAVWTQEQVTGCAKWPQAQFLGDVQTLRSQLDSLGHTIAISADEWGLGPPWDTRTFGTPHGMYAAGFLGMATRAAGEYNMPFTNYFEPINEGAIAVRLIV
jgi:hypothetical protein